MSKALALAAARAPVLPAPQQSPRGDIPPPVKKKIGLPSAAARCRACHTSISQGISSHLASPACGLISACSLANCSGDILETFVALLDVARLGFWARACFVRKHVRAMPRLASAMVLLSVVNTNFLRSSVSERATRTCIILFQTSERRQAKSGLHRKSEAPTGAALLWRSHVAALATAATRRFFWELLSRHSSRFVVPCISAPIATGAAAGVTINRATAD